jgi:hypothetical protein
MKILMKKSLMTLIAASIFTISGAQATTFSKQMKLGIVNSAPYGKEVIIYNDEQTKCLAVSSKSNASAKSLTYATCRKDEADTWIITNAGKMKNKRSGKCLSTPNGMDKLILKHCNFMYSRDYMTHDFIILDHLNVEDQEVSEIANIR